MGLRIPPFVFTEHGILMLSSEKSKKKIGYTVKEKQKTYGKKSWGVRSGFKTTQFYHP